MDATLFVLCLIGFICLLPLALYCLGLAYLNNRDRPTMVPGSWDFAGVLLALSGFLVLGGPLLLAVADSAWRAVWLRGNFAQLRAAWDNSGGMWVGVWAIYFLGVVAFVAGSLYARRHHTVIYHLDVSLFPQLIESIAEQLGRPFRSQPGGFVFGTGPEREDRFFLEVRLFRWFRHASLEWIDAEPTSRIEIEEALSRELPRLTPRTNPATNLLFTIASCLFFLMLFCLMFMASFLFFAPA